MVLDHESIQRSMFRQSGLASFPYQPLDLSTANPTGVVAATSKGAKQSAILPTSGASGSGGVAAPNDFPFDDLDAFLDFYTTSIESTSKSTESHLGMESSPPDVSEPKQISNNAAAAAATTPESVLDVCPEPNCPHCLAYKELIAKAGGSDAVTSLSPAFPDGSVGSPQSHNMDVQSHGTSSSMGVPSPPLSGNLTPDVTNPQIFNNDDLQGLFATWSPDPEVSTTPKHSPPPPPLKSKDALLQNTLRKTNSQNHVSGNDSPMQLVKALTRSPSPPPAYKLNSAVPPPIDKEPKAFGSNVIHLGNGMALTEREVVDMPVHELNRLLYQSKLTEAEISLIKETRRRGKNKVAARNCRKRKMDTISELEKEVDELKAKKDKVAEERDLLAREVEIYKSKTESLTRFILEKVKYGSGLKLNIDQLALDKAEDGRLFVIPNLSVSGDEDGHLAVIA